MAKKNYIGLKAKGMGFDAHLTVMYTGNLTRWEVHNISGLLSRLRSFHVVYRQSIQMFGPDNNIPVLTVVPEPSLWNLRKILEKLATEGHIPNRSQYEWNPHITLKWEEPTTLHIPNQIELHALDLY